MISVGGGSATGPCQVVALPPGEIWLRCDSVDELLLHLDALLEAGHVPMVIAFLDGRRLPVTAVSSDILETHGTYDEELQQIIKVKFYTPPSSWIPHFQRSKMRLNPQKKTAVIHLTTPIRLTQLYDLGLRLLQPKKAP
ncbi:hypothetical protein Pisl_1546 [Pyrobaculum islandicum DSM 4184]|uniref:Uncharacterized protein n=1 Tax=Pyrobaculum islandicum (strain DSM 4184 / JCM 9189 / GEO3) TaxID=384616 RepID=A1RUR9_PYRIL|nr:hypothetical protein Pisl_1546 [Pyrobaculum islandicum DSM 4184]